MNAILAALVNGAILSALATAAVWLALRVAPRRLLNAASRYVVWWAALAVTIILPTLFSPRASPPTVAQPTLNVPALADILFTRGAGQPVEQPFRTAAELLPRAPRASAAATQGARPTLRWPSFPLKVPAARWPQWVLAAWLVTSVLMLIRLIVSWTLLRRRSARAFDAPAQLRARADLWLALCGSTRRGVRLAGSTEIAIPAAVGPLRPAILIPARLLDKMDETALDQIGLHEAAHLARRDDCALLAQRIIEAVLVLHPMVRWIGRRIDLEREIACDDFVLAVTGSSRSYASCLTRMVELSAGARPSLAAAAASSHLAKRVETLLDRSRHTGTRLLKARLAVIVATLAVIAWMAGRSPGLLAFATPPGLPVLRAILPQLAAPQHPEAILFSAALSAQQAGFEGIAVNAVTGQPLGGVHVKLVAVTLAGASEAYGAISGRDGRFSMAIVAPGSYLLLPERTGFVHMMTPSGALPAASLLLKPGERVVDYKLEMTPRAVVAGRVTDESGDPVPNVPVELTPVSPGAPAPSSLRSGGIRATTDDRGEFWISGGPGKFYVKATPGGGTNQPSEIRTDGTAEAIYGPTWYPGAPSAERASVVEAVAGGDVSGLEIRLARQRRMAIAGVVTGMPAGEGSSVLILLHSGDSPDRLTPMRAVGAQPDGKFSFGRLAPAYYRVYASSSGEVPMLSPSVDVRPESPDAVDIRLVLTPGGELTGTFQIEGDPPGTPAEGRTVQLQPVGISAAARSGTVNKDGSFRIGNVPAARFRVTVQPLPENAYVKTVRLGGAEARDNEVDLTRGAQGAQLKVTVGRNGAQLSGAVLEGDGRPMAKAAAIVILATDPDHVSFALDHVSPDSGGRVTPDGRYSFKGIRPGRYIVFAIDALRSGSLKTTEDLKKLAVAAEPIEIKEGDRIVKNLKVVLKEEVDARQ